MLHILILFSILTFEKYLFQLKENWFGQHFFKEIRLYEQMCNHFYGVLRCIDWMPPGETLIGRNKEIHFRKRNN